MDRGWAQGLVALARLWLAPEPAAAATAHQQAREQAPAAVMAPAPLAREPAMEAQLARASAQEPVAMAETLDLTTAAMLPTGKSKVFCIIAIPLCSYLTQSQ